MKHLWNIAIVSFVLPLTLLAQEPRQTEKQSGMMDSCKAMMADREKMMEEMRASQQKLEELVSRMRSAQGDAKVEALEDTVAALVAQRGKNVERMQEMQERMMGHMMEHMQNGQSMQCPMMKDTSKS